MITTDKIRLLDSIDPGTLDDIPHLLHNDGQPLTDDEMALFSSLTVPDLEQYQAIWRARADQAEASAATSTRLIQLLGPYYEQHPGILFGDLLPLIPEPDRSAVIALARVVETEMAGPR